jgi:uncharacterized membrane protein
VFLVTVTLALGIFFRVTNISQKVYWHDEVFTSIRAAGYTGEEIIGEVFTGIPISPDKLLHYQKLNSRRNWDKTWYSLTTHPEHPPLYYLLTRLFMELFGSKVAAVRSLSVVFSLLAFPALYWLYRELFESKGQWIAIALFAISPFHVLYAQEARQSSLWTLVTLLSSAALLQAMRVQTWTGWGIYAVTVALNLYTFLLSILVLICHGIFAIAMGLSVRRFLLSLLAGIIAFTPWIIVLIQNWLSLESKTAWIKTSPPKSLLIKLWGLHISSSFIDFGLPLESIYTYIVPPIVLGLVGYALWILYYHAPRRAWLFVVLLIVLPTSALILPDLILGGQRSSHTRYFVPMLIGVQLAIAYLLNYLLQQHSLFLQRLLLVILLTVGIISCTASWRSPTWWNKGISYGNSSVAAFLNSQDQPIVISSLGDTTLGNVISLSYLVKNEVRFQLAIDPVVPKLAPSGNNFLFYPTPTLIESLQTTYLLEPVEYNKLPLPAPLLKLVHR